MGFYSKFTPNSNQLSELINSSISIFWHVTYLINYSIQLLVCCFHQSATGDTRENLDFAVFRQNRV